MYRFDSQGGVATMNGKTERPSWAAVSTVGSNEAQLYSPRRVGWMPDQSIGVRIASMPPAFMYSASLVVSAFCGTIPKKFRGGRGVAAAEAGVVASCARR